MCFKFFIINTPSVKFWLLWLNPQQWVKTSTKKMLCVWYLTVYDGVAPVRQILEVLSIHLLSLLQGLPTFC